jgi:hypothetical protein
MNQEDLQKEIELYIQKINSYQKDMLRLEGIIIYLKNKMKDLEKRV